MNRTSRRKIYYLGLLVALGAPLVLVGIYWQLPFWVWLLIALALLIPGRIGTYLFRDLFRGRNLLEKGEYQASIETTERFLATLKRQPWRRHFIHTMSGIFTSDVEAMAWTNLGVAHMYRGHLDRAEDCWRRAIERDPDYPLPYFNLSAVATVRGDEEGADRFGAIAKEKGYANTVSDQLIRTVSKAYSRAVASAKP